MWTGGALWGGGVWKKYLPVHNSIVIFGKLSLGGNLIVQLCIFSYKDKAMLGYMSSKCFFLAEIGCVDDLFAILTSHIICWQLYKYTNCKTASCKIKVLLAMGQS